MNNKVIWMVIGFCAVTSCVSCAPVEHTVVFGKSDKFAGWPANNGIWTWGDKEILVGFSYGNYEEKKGHDITDPKFSVLGRSFDGGKTWKIEDPENFIGDEVQPKPAPGGINFAHPDFAMRVRNSQILISYDRGHIWWGPYEMGRFGLDNTELSEITSRTDYIVSSADDCLIFLSARQPSKFATDRAFCVRTTDGGKTFRFVSWMVPPGDPHRAVMPSTVRCSSSRLVSALRRRAHPEDVCWVDAYVSNDNGESWSFLSKIGDCGPWNGNPPAMVRLRDGRLSCVYGSRAQRRIYTRLSSDEGASWGAEIVLRDDFRIDTEPDLGYPRLVQRPDGKLVTMYYWTTEKRPQQHIAATIWDPDRIAK